MSAMRFHARISKGKETVSEFDSAGFTQKDLNEGRLTFSHSWKPDALVGHRLAAQHV